MVEVAAAEVLGDGQAAQAVAGVVEIPGPWGDIGVLREGLEHHSAPPRLVLTCPACRAAPRLDTGSTAGCIPAAPTGPTSSGSC